MLLIKEYLAQLCIKCNWSGNIQIADERLYDKSLKNEITIFEWEKCEKYASCVWETA